MSTGNLEAIRDWVNEKVAFNIATREQIDNIFKKKLDKTLITIVADDGSNRLSDSYTGLMSWADGLGIPWTLAVPTDAPKQSSGSYKLDELQNFVANGHEVVMHGITTNDSARTMSVSEFETNVRDCIAWAKENGFNDKAYVIPSGLQVTDVDFDKKIGILAKYGIDMAFNVNTSAETTQASGYADWYSYDNGKGGQFGVGGNINVVPFAKMPNGYSKRLLLNRWEITQSNNYDKLSWIKTSIDKYIAMNSFLVFFCHPHTTGYLNPDADGKTGADYFKSQIEYILANHRNEVEFVTPSQAMKRLNRVVGRSN